MSYIQIFADAFLHYTCECCGQSFSGRPAYRAGLIQCQACASGEHRHERIPDAA